jgi:DNA-directed RNA polymerase subunit RPC12/RpoP
MREKYYFCFWCGAEYKNKEELESSCPGDTEEDHE